MPGTLHITNGDSVSLRDTGLGGEVLAWQDVLHEGPVPAQLTLEQMRPVRARFLAELSGRPESEIAAGLERRDDALARFRDRDEVVLWFEHDLYDQLQLIQILDWFARQDNAGGCVVSLVNAGRYLGPMSPEELVALYPTRVPVTRAHFDAASRAWRAFRSPDPKALVPFLSDDTPALPYLSGVLRRHLEQFPSTENGLSRTERQILEIAGGGVNRANAIFRADCDREERIFMGDTVFFSYLRGLANSPVPLLRIAPHEARFGESFVEITREGGAALRAEADHIALNGIDRWLGGVHLQRGSVWRWSSRDGCFVN